MIYKLFPQLIVARGTHAASSYGATPRSSKILKHFAPLKAFGPREFVDPEFLEEVQIERMDRVEQRRLWGDGNPSLVHSSTELAPFQHTFPKHYALQWEVSLNPLGAVPSHTCSSPFILTGHGRILLNESEVELSLHTPLLAGPSTVTATPGSFVHLFGIEDGVSTHPLGILPMTEQQQRETLLSHPEASFDRLLLVDAYPFAPSTDTLLYIHSGMVSLSEDGVPADIIYTGEERFMEPGSYTLTPMGGAPAILFFLQKN